MCWYKVVTMIIIILISINIIIILLHLWVLLLQHNLNARKQSKFWCLWNRESIESPMISLKVFWLERKNHQGNYIQHNLVTLNIGNFSTNCLWKKKGRLWANTNKQKLSWVCSDNHKCCLLFAHSFTCLHWLREWNRLHRKWFR